MIFTEESARKWSTLIFQKSVSRKTQNHWKWFLTLWFYCSDIPIPDRHKCLWLEDIGRQSCADLRTGSTKSSKRTTFDGNGRHIRRTLDRFSSCVLILTISRYSNVCQSVGSRIVHDNLSLQSNSDVTSQCQVLALESFGKRYLVVVMRHLFRKLFMIDWSIACYHHLVMYGGGQIKCKIIADFPSRDGYSLLRSSTLTSPISGWLIN